MITTVKQLKDAFSTYKNELPYVTLRDDGTYAGWVSDFKFGFIGNKQHFALDLSKEKDRFLLYVLAVVWSRSGPWENSAYFVAHLKFNGLDEPKLWCQQSFVKEQQRSREKDAANILKVIDKPVSRKKVSFRSDIYDSVSTLATHWLSLENMLIDCMREGSYLPFVLKLRDIDGLGVNGKKMMIKIPLILRELRCQKVLDNIPGKYCCVPDDRVKEAAKCLKDMKLSPAYPKISNLLKASEQIFEEFGDLYDLPLFAYNDLMKLILTQKPT